jgi:hypothetical protein
MTCRHCHVDAGPDRVREGHGPRDDRRLPAGPRSDIREDRRHHRRRAGAPIPISAISSTRACSAETRHGPVQPDRPPAASLRRPPGLVRGAAWSGVLCRTIGGSTRTPSGARGRTRSRSKRSAG